MVSIAEEFVKVSSVPVIIQPNAGVPTLEGGRLVYPETPEFMAEQVKKLIAAGVKIIGGCCGTTPDHITAIEKVVREYSLDAGRS
jgi:5-methyltetrahydrofolate--homocysteine methyltransferase